MLRCETTGQGALLVPARCEAVAASDERGVWLPATCAVSHAARCPPSVTLAVNEACCREAARIEQARVDLLDDLMTGAARRLLALGRGYTVERVGDVIYLQSPQNGERSVVVGNLRDRWQGTIQAVRADDTIRIVLTATVEQNRRNTQDEEDWYTLDARQVRPYFTFMMQRVNAEAAALCRAVPVDSTTVRCRTP